MFGLWKLGYFKLFSEFYSLLPVIQAGLPDIQAGKF